MKTTKLTIVLTITALFCLSLQSIAQSTSTNQLGLRLGGFSGITFRHISGNNVGVQADLLMHHDGNWTILSGMAEKHFPLGENFVLFVGGGAFFGAHRYWHDERYNDYYWDPSVGLEGTIGCDYYIRKVPLNVGLDVTPRFSFFDTPFPWDAAISLHYIF